MIGKGTTGVVVVPDPELVDVPAARQGPLSGMFNVPQVVSPLAPVHAASANPVRTKAETDARRMIDSHDPKDSLFNLYEFR